MCTAEPAPAAQDRLGKLLALLQHSPDDPFCLYGVAQEHASRGRHEEALTWYDRALAADPDGSYAYFHKARSLVELGQRAAAIATLQAGLAAAARTGDTHARGEIADFLSQLELNGEGSS